MRLLCADDEDFKGAGEHGGAGARLLGGGRRRRTEFCGDEIDGVRLRVEGQGARAHGGGDGLEDSVLVRRILMDDGERAFAIGAEDEPGFRIEGGSVGALADGDGGEEFSGGGVEDGHDLVAADGEETSEFAVDGDAAGAVASGEGPESGDGAALDVNAGDAVLILNVDEDVAVLVGGGELGLSIERDGGDDGGLDGIDEGDVAAASVESEEEVREGVVEDGVGIGSGFDLAGLLEGFEVEDGDGIGASIAGGGEAEIGGESDAVYALGVWNVSESFSGCRINRHDVGAAGDEEAIAVGVIGEIVPATFSRDGETVGELIFGGIHGKSERGEEEGDGEKEKQLRFHEWLRVARL